MLFIEEAENLPLSDVLPVIQKRIMHETFYFGVKTLKNPFDFWVYQELIYQQQPDVIIEIGNNWGGSTLAIAHLLDNVNKGQLIAVDISHEKIAEKVRNHPRIVLIEGDAIESYGVVKDLIKNEDNVMIIEDSAHTYKNTLAVLENYSSLIPVGGYFIVEDSICHHGLSVGPSPGPYEAITDFLSKRDNFIADRSKESFLITWNPKGFLRRTK